MTIIIYFNIDRLLHVLKLQHLIFNSKYDKKLFLDPFYYNIPVHGKYIDISFSDNNEVFII